MSQTDSLNEGRIQPDDPDNEERIADDDLSLGDPTRRRVDLSPEDEEVARNATMRINQMVQQRKELIDILLRVIRDPRRASYTAQEQLRRIKAKEGPWAS